MSNTLAIAGVTAVLKDLLDSGLIEHRTVDALGVGVTVSSVAPDRVPVSGTGLAPRLNLFLYQATPNAAYRNVDLPSRDARGSRTRNPPLALDLHYLLTAYGVAELEAEVLLGYALQLLHENPVLGRAQIRTALNPNPVGNNTLPSLYRALRSADLAEQVEMLKITPAQVSTEEMSRLWSALQANFRPSAAFHVSVVLIERQRPAITPLPVLRRGERDQGVTVVPGLEVPVPTLQTLSAPAHGTPSVLRLGDAFELGGHHLGGTQRALVFRNSVFGVRYTQALPDGTDDALVAAALNAAPAAMPAGLYEVELQVQRPDRLAPQTSNALPVAIAPAITNFVGIVMSRNPQNVLSLRLDCEPELRVGQRVSLALGGREVAAEAITATTGQARFLFDDAPPAGGQPLLRLKVDGIESVSVNRAAVPPVFFDHRVTLP